MHGSHGDMDISIENVAKIEGHTNLDVVVRGGEVKDVKLKISENKRFYTQAIRGKPFASMPQLVSRICGTCSIAHLTCCIEAVENALRFEPSPQTMLLRKLAMAGLMTRDHALHLYFFSLPDVLGIDSVLELTDSKPELVRTAFDVKAAGNALSTLVSGRAVHATIQMVGGFANVPSREQSKEVIAKLRAARPAVLDLLHTYAEWPETFVSESNYVALVTQNYDFLDGEIMDSRGLCIPEKQYWNHLNRVVIPYSNATGFQFEGTPYKAGALARMNLNKDKLHKDTKPDAAFALKAFPSKNVFHNNLAQAIEILHCIDSASETLESTDFKKEAVPRLEPRAGEGVGVVEAPRGILYYLLELDKAGNVVYGNLVIPSAQNQINMEKDIGEFLPHVLDKPKEEIAHELEKLIRAYDPCMSCATHFLKVNWL